MEQYWNLECRLRNTGWGAVRRVMPAKWGRKE